MDSDISCNQDFEMSFELVEGIIVSKLQLSMASAVPTPADNMNGGTIVQANGKSIQLYGHTWNSFKLQDTYEFDPFSKLRALITSGSHINIFVCFSEKENILETQNSNSFCIQVGRSKFIYSTFFGNMHVDGLRIYRMNLALGKSTDFSSFTFEGRSELVVDGRPETAFKSIREDNPYLEIYLSRTYLINSIVIQKGQKCRDYQLTDMSISILDEEGNIKFHHYYDSHKDILKVETPPTYGSRVKVRLHGQRRILCVGEIDVIEARGEPLRDIEMPIGKFENGTVANYVTFIQESYDDVSLVSDLRLVYGSLN